MARHPLFNDVLDAAPDAILLVSRDGTILAANRAVDDLFGWPPGELVGKSVEVLVPPAHRAGHVPLVRGYVEHPRVRAMGAVSTIRGVTRDGREIPLDIKLAPLVFQDEVLTTAVIRDMSAFASMHARALDHAAQLADVNRRLEDALGELGRRNSELEHVSREKSELLGVAAHDLRNPLAAIRGFAELLGSQELGALNPAERRLVGRIEHTADHMLRLLNSILDMAAIDAGRLELRRTSADLGAITREVVAVERVFAEHKGIRLDDEGLEGLGEGDVDVPKVQQVLHNLVNNAVKFSPRGARVSVRGLREGTTVRVSVVDRGPGLSATQVERIFRPFERGPAVPTGGEPSNGLGLAIARRIAEAHGGRIEVRSTPGDGAEFTLLLDLPYSFPASIPTSS